MFENPVMSKEMCELTIHDLYSPTYEFYYIVDINTGILRPIKNDEGELIRINVSSGSIQEISNQVLNIHKRYADQWIIAFRGTEPLLNKMQ